MLTRISFLKQKYIASAERTLFQYLLEIAKLEKALGHSQNSIPNAVLEVAPPDPKSKLPSRANAEMNIWKGTTQPKKPPTM